MENIKTHFTVPDRKLFETKMLNWLKRFNIFCFLNNNGFPEPDAFDCYVAVGVEEEIVLNRNESPFEKLQEFHDRHGSWLFGHFNYELNTGLPQLKRATIEFPDGYFFSPEIIFRIKDKEVESLKCKGDPSVIFSEIMNSTDEFLSSKKSSSIRSRISKDEYLRAIENVKRHIKLGDCYELNFCQEFYSDVDDDPAGLYRRLNKISPQPFSAFYRVNGNYCCCASPERFLKKTARQLLSQPIKGTAPRGEDAVKDEENFLSLKNSAKDKSENVMVVDLVRNDLSRVCKPGTVRVPELFSIRSFPGVHQMISTVTGEMEDRVQFSEALKVAFPMGSMTGAPKVRVMQLIDEYEASARGLFSGSIGYITPEGDFDFNVVIRSLFFNEDEKKLAFMAGGGITHYSDAESEYEESLLKTAAIRKLLDEPH